MTQDQPDTVDFFSHQALPAPRLTADEARRIAAEHFGLAVRAEALGSQQDANFLLTHGDGSPAAVLKIANPAFTTTEIDAQDTAADLIADAHPGLRVATVVRDVDGVRRTATIPTGNGPVTARLLRHLRGGTLSGSRHLTPRTVAAMGRVAGQVSATLRPFRHPGLERVLQWDPRHADRVVTRLAGHVETERRSVVLAAAADAWAVLLGVADRLPRQAVHLDLTDDNLVISPDRPVPLPDGIIDFGDLADSWAVCELAVTLSSILHHDGMEPHHALPAVRAFHEIRPLSGGEATALWPLVVLRAATLVVSGRHQAAVDGDNAYVNAALEREWRIFEQARAVPTAVMTELIVETLGLARRRATAAVPAVPVLAATDPAGIAVLDLAVDSDAMDHGAWLEDAASDRLAAGLLTAGATTVATRYGQAQLTAAPALSTTSPATIATGVDLWLDGPTVLQAPDDGEVLAAAPGRAAVTFGPHVLHLEFPDAAHPALPAGSFVHAGDPLVALPAGTRVHACLARPGAPTIPALVRPEYAVGWLAFTADPAPLLGLPAAGGAAPEDDLLARREAAFAPVQEHYYESPPRIERGWRHHLVSVEGRSYLDMVNNVTPLGHAHPRVEQAISRQLRRLNTNSRFHYAAVVRFTERLADLLPAPLDTVFLVNSGSEAVDLAIRLAIGATGQPDVVALREAYHGWTYASDAVSTSLQDNPQALGTRPSWVHTVDSPNSYRGRWRGEQAQNYALEAVQAIDGLAASGRPPGAFLSESYYGNAGGVALPGGYLRQVYAAVRRHGGLAIADEIQVGYGRLGTWFWGFEEQQAVPDIVCVAKAMGNGHPLGAVITTRAVADRYRDQGYFFSSTGGSPVSSVAGLTVLDTLRDEDLPGNAARTGAHLKAELQALAEHHPVIGTVHGCGLYLGVELVRDRHTLEPATEETAELCERLLDLGVIVQPTGDHLNVLKIKPPLCIDPAGADFFVGTLDRALTELGHRGGIRPDGNPPTPPGSSTG